MATIVILEHLLQRVARRPFLVYSLGERWMKAGHEVLVHYGTENAPRADLAILNVDASEVPSAYLDLAGRYPLAINGRVADIRKHRYSTLRIFRGDVSWRGPVIVKTDRNSGGRPERELQRVARRAGLVCDIPEGPYLPDYPVYESAAEVPDSVWADPGLIVERFVPEKTQGGWYVHTWLFFGPAERASRWLASAPLAKGHHLIERSDTEVPAEIRAVREGMRMDYGKFDYIVHEGRPVLLDANATPGVPPGAKLDAAADALAAGLSRWLPEAA